MDVDPRRVHYFGGPATQPGIGGVLVYRCRLCGGEERSTRVPDVILATIAVTTRLGFPPAWGMIDRQMVDSHPCPDGRRGVTDFVGAEPN